MPRCWTDALTVLRRHANWPIPPSREAQSAAECLTRYMAIQLESGHIGTTVEGRRRRRLNSYTTELEAMLWLEPDSSPSPSPRPDSKNVARAKAKQRALYARLVVTELDDGPARDYDLRRQPNNTQPVLTSEERLRFERELAQDTFTDEEQRRWDERMDERAFKKGAWLSDSDDPDSEDSDLFY